MAHHYKVKPSEILSIKNDYTAYCLDEIGLMLWNAATQEDGSVDFTKIYNKQPTKKQGVHELIELAGGG